jgi:3-phosphoshikimate 1-carboxyvinyltransferase
VRERIDVAPDASSATAWLALAAIHGATVTIPGLALLSRQADVAFAAILRDAGCTVTEDGGGVTCSGRLARGITADMRHCPDAVPAAVAAAAFAPAPSHLTGVAHLAHKESDRLAVLASRFAMLGIAVKSDGESIRVTPGSIAVGGRVTIDPAGDHRMAMACAIAATALPVGMDVLIDTPEVVNKSYPRFFDELSRIAREWA